MKVNDVRKGKIPIIFSIIVLLTSPLSGMTELSYAGTTDGLETQPVESKQVLNDKNTSETIEIETDTSKCSSDKIPIENVSEAVASPSEERNKTVINLADLQKYVEFLNEYGMDMDLDWIGLAGWMVLIEDSLSDIKINKKEELGWEKGAKVTIELNYNKGSIDIDNYEFTAPVETSSSMATANAGLFRGIYLRALIQKYGVALPKDEEQVYSISILSPVEVYSLDKTICYKIYIEGSELLLDIERVKAKYSTDTDSEDAENSLSLLVTLNKKFKYLTAGKNEALWHVSNSDESFQYPLRVPSVLTKVNFSLATPPQLKLHAKENNSLKLNEDVDKLNLSEFVSVSDTMKETVGDESQITYEWVTKPDTTKAGTTVGVIKAVEKYGEYLNIDTTEVLFRVDNDQLTAETSPQTVPLGTVSNTLDTNKFVENVKLGDTTLTSDQYTTKLVGTLPTDTVGEKTAKVLISANDYPSEIEMDVPVTVTWGNTILLNGSSRRSIGAYTYFPEVDRVEISWGSEENEREINGSFGEEVYYRISMYQPEKESFLIGEMNRKWDLIGRGSQPASIINDIPSRGIDVSEGDIMEIYHAQSLSHQRMLQIYTDETPTDLSRHVETTYVELTKDGYRPLQFNYATPKGGTISISTTDEELDHKVNEYIDLSNAPQAKVVGFVKYPDRSKEGNTKGTIRVQEPLSTGKNIQQDYEVSFTAEEESVFQIDQVSDFDFGSVKKSSQEQTIPIKNGEEAPSIQVTNRSKIDEWTLEVHQTKEFSDKNGHTLEGAEMTLDRLTSSGDSQLLLQSKPIKLTEDATEVAWYFNPNNSNPNGTSTIHFGTKDSNGVSLRIPKNTIQNTTDYQAEITWELIADPTLNTDK